MPRSPRAFAFMNGRVRTERPVNNDQHHAGGYENSYYGSSDFDIRQTFTTAASYSIPTPRGNALVKQILGQWGSPKRRVSRACL
jgi:hypothetical protein